MKAKRLILLSVVVVIAGILMVFIINQVKLNCSTLESREIRLKEISNLGEATTISQEIVIDDYIISGYTTNNNQHGLAVFAPYGNGEYRFQTNINRQKDELLFITVNINQKLYNLFWANKAELDYAEITYTIDGKNGETTKLDARDNSILYQEAPSKSFAIEYSFVDINGNRYE